MKKDSKTAEWTFLTNHSHVLLCLATAPDQTLREIAERVGVTERAVLRIVSELEQAGYIARYRVGRNNSYRIFGDRPLRHPVEKHQKVSALLALVKK